MYNVGFGDCFLVTIPNELRPLRILFDCGSVGAAPDIAMEDVLEQLFLDATDPGAATPRIDVVVCTHRHRDHVSGFAKPGWERVQVKEVWMPWTEHPTDPEARRIRNTQAGLAARLEASLTARLTASPNDAGLAMAQALAANALSNERAMAVLHEGFAGRPARKFFPARDSTELQYDASHVLPDMSVFVLGPSRTEAVIRDMDPPPGKSYMQLAASRDDSGQVPMAFGPEWRLEPSAYQAPIFGDTGTVPSGTPTTTLGLWLKNSRKLPTLSLDDMDAIAKAGDMELAVAVALDKAVNGTSLMLVLKIGAVHLLFPGDAQWGTWQAALDNPMARALLEKTSFYKIGHHGSHNATPTDFVEHILPNDTRGMISTRPISQWPDIPRQPLLTALTQHHCTFARSDQPADADQNVFTTGALFIDTEIPLL